MSRPSDALAARQATDTTLTAPLLGLGAVALLVGGACAGFYPAWRAACMPPTDTLAAP